MDRPDSINLIYSEPSSWYESWKKKTGYMTRFLIYFVLLVTAVGFAFGGCDSAALIPKQILQKLELSRLFYSPFCEDTIYEFVISLIWLTSYVKNLEKAIGGKALAVQIFFLSFTSNVVYVLWSYILCSWANVCELMNEPVCGMLGIILALILIYPLFEKSYVNGMLRIPTDYLPLAIIIFMALLRNTIPFDLIIPIALGYLQRMKIVNFAPLEYLEIAFARLENKLKLHDFYQKFFSPSRNGFNLAEDENENIPYGNSDDEHARELKRLSMLEAALERANHSHN